MLMPLPPCFRHYAFFDAADYCHCRYASAFAAISCRAIFAAYAMPPPLALFDV